MRGKGQVFIVTRLRNRGGDLFEYPADEVVSLVNPGKVTAVGNWLMCWAAVEVMWLVLSCRVFRLGALLGILSLLLTSMEMGESLSLVQVTVKPPKSCPVGI